MKIGYIRQSKYQEEARTWEKIKLKWREFRKMILVEHRGDSVFFLLPLTKKEKEKKKIGNKLNRLLNKEGIQDIVFSKDCQGEVEIRNFLYGSEKNLLDGKRLYKVMIDKILEYVIQELGMEKREAEVTFLMNENTEYNFYLIEKLARQIKRVNIVTNHIESFRKLEKKLYEEEGILITISNNKRRSLAKAQIIVNMDFPIELVNKFEIYPKAIWIGIDNVDQIKSKRFQGIYITGYHISWQGKEKEEDFEDTVFYESLLWEKRKIKEWIDEINKDKVRIKTLIGRNGIIVKEEYKNLQLKA